MSSHGSHPDRAESERTDSSLDVSKIQKNISDLKSSLLAVQTTVGGDKLTKEIIEQLGSYESMLPDVQAVQENIDAVRREIIDPVRKQLAESDQKLSSANDRIGQANQRIIQAETENKKLWLKGIIYGVLLGLATNIFSVPISEKFWAKSDSPQTVPHTPQNSAVAPPSSDDLFPEGGLGAIPSPDLSELKSHLVLAIFQSDAASKQRVAQLHQSRGLAKGLTDSQKSVTKASVRLALGDSAGALKEIGQDSSVDDTVDHAAIRTVALLNMRDRLGVLPNLSRLNGESWLGITEQQKSSLTRRACSDVIIDKLLVSKSFESIGACLRNTSVRLGNGSGIRDRRAAAVLKLKKMGFLESKIELADLSGNYVSTHVYFSEEYSVIAPAVASNLATYSKSAPKGSASIDRIKKASSDLVIVLGVDEKQ